MVVDAQTDQLLVARRLGTAAGLFMALRCKYSPTADHALQVALMCSAWAQELGVSAEERETIEIAALLHDLWLIGVPDRILHKPAGLDAEEVEVLRQCRRAGGDMLRASGAAASLLQTVDCTAAWFDGSYSEGRPVGHEIPRGARMIAIVEAFQSMTTDRIFRPACSKERALAELVRCAGTQFDPELVEQFADLAMRDQSQLYRQQATRWLQELPSQPVHALWSHDWSVPDATNMHVAAYFQAKILDNTRDCVVLVDPALHVIGWNRRTEQLTGIVAESIIGRVWTPEIVTLRDVEGRLVDQRRCPLRRAVATCLQALDRYSFTTCRGGRITVDVQTIPVLNQKGALLGAAMLMRDVSSERSLQELCENLHTRATKDPLTGAANRSELEHVQAQLLDDYRKHGTPVSVMICDLDHFKAINDRFGHQAGDEVLVKTAAVLQDHARPGDLVARYGGEEFVLVCAACGIAAATRRAELIRDRLSEVEHWALGGRCATASIGVTQAQPGDTVDTLLRRADRALYQAKNAGRNQVIQLGGGATDEEPVRRWAFWKRGGTQRAEALVEQDMLVPGPLKFVWEKLRGFVADQQAAVTETREGTLELALSSLLPTQRCKGDLSCTFLVTIQFSAGCSAVEHPGGAATGEPEEIRLHVKVAVDKLPAHARREILARAREITASFRAYLMARTVSPLAPDVLLQQNQSLLLPAWTPK
jgi:diguanylate cyclase (GGDEF)-like protein/PAS domain S-box-containing protein